MNARSELTLLRVLPKLQGDTQRRQWGAKFVARISNELPGAARLVMQTLQQVIQRGPEELYLVACLLHSQKSIIGLGQSLSLSSKVIHGAQCTPHREPYRYTHAGDNQRENYRKSDDDGSLGALNWLFAQNRAHHRVGSRNVSRLAYDLFWPMAHVNDRRSDQLFRGKRIWADAHVGSYTRA